ncbi:MAG: dihydroorotate dehydrogenase, partial [Actinobacteria bacterium]|nr:dihydroorotate dehydrogenase [Actinomycetota bacterium]
PRLHPVGAGMINAVGLQGPGVEYWLHNLLPPLVEAGAAVVCSIWGRSVDDYARAADMLAQAPSEVIAVEVNLSCPNLEGRGSIFAHDAALSAEVIDACSVAGRPLWAKLSPNTDRIVEVASAVVDAGADALTLVNTLLGLAIDPQTRRPALGNGGVHAVAVRAIADVHREMPTVPIIGVGGISTGWDAIEMMLAGASAVQVGTASFLDPRAPLRIATEMVRWARDNGVERLGDLTGSAIR